MEQHTSYTYLSEPFRLVKFYAFDRIFKWNISRPSFQVEEFTRICKFFFFASFTNSSCSSSFCLSKTKPTRIQLNEKMNYLPNPLIGPNTVLSSIVLQFQRRFLNWCLHSCWIFVEYETEIKTKRIPRLNYGLKIAAYFSVVVVVVVFLRSLSIK